MVKIEVEVRMTEMMMDGCGNEDNGEEVVEVMREMKLVEIKLEMMVKVVEKEVAMKAWCMGGRGDGGSRSGSSGPSDGRGDVGDETNKGKA